MRHRLMSLTILFLACLLLSSCNLLPVQTDSSDAASTSAATDQPSAVPAAAPEQTDTAPKNANWVMEINDTQKYTDELGIIWNYTLTLHASKSGGTDVTGEYTGDALLIIEPDFASVQAAAAGEGTTLLSMLFNYRAECQSLSFVVEKLGSETEDGPLAPLTNIDFTAESSAAFDATQEPVTMTIQDEDGPKTGSGGGGGAAVTVPFTVDITGASVSIKFANLPQPFETAFNGTVTGDVLPG